ncbi:hypothetical protein OG596_06635 [Streptomyces sp. NBC_01102]|uniref:hypothetical protein n=1 Tax=unclassified Streptomyces TaxID=2593676 RepID=UPI00386EDBD6|nr:hypothetical protein OG596_06635 [Streptomyces sp. NBC_01102]
MRQLRPLHRYGIPILAPLALLAACSSGDDSTSAARRADASTAVPGKDTASPTPTPVLDADPTRLPKDREAALDLIGRVIADPESFGPGVVKRSPYESDPATWPVLGSDCAWHQEKPASNVLATLTRSFEVPAAQGRGPVRLSAVVTVHRTRDDARWEMAESIEETMRCPTQQLQQGERIGSMISGALMGGEGGQSTSEDSLTESGEYSSTALGGPHAYFWQQAQSLQFTVAATGRGAEGRTEEEISGLVIQGLSTMLVRIESAVEKQS